MNNPNCPICGSDESIELGTPKQPRKNLQKYIRDNYKIISCKACKFYYVYPKIDLTTFELTQFYDTEYFPTLNNWHFKARNRDIKSRLSILKTKNQNKLKNYLDIGCGEGYTLLEATNLGFKTFGIDIADNRIEDAKKLEICFFSGELFEANYPDNYFDIIYMDSVLEHLVNPSLYLKEIKRILRLDGIAYIGVPNEDSLFDKFRSIIFRIKYKGKISAKIKPFLPPFHVSGFNKNSLKLIIEKTGFEIIEMNNFATRFEFRKYSPYSIGFFIHLLTLPIDLLAIIFKMEKYLEVYIKKNQDIK